MRTHTHHSGIPLVHFSLMKLRFSTNSMDIQGDSSGRYCLGLTVIFGYVIAYHIVLCRQEFDRGGRAE